MNDTDQPLVGTRIEVYWILDNSFYPGHISGYTEGGKSLVKYDDGDEESIYLNEE